VVPSPQLTKTWKSAGIVVALLLVIVASVPWTFAGGDTLSTGPGVPLSVEWPTWSTPKTGDAGWVSP
jgi:hypothetical protein